LCLLGITAAGVAEASYNPHKIALLEKKLNHVAGSKTFIDKKSIYKQSQFELTKKLAAKRTWRPESIDSRIAELAELACRAWPAI